MYATATATSRCSSPIFFTSIHLSRMIKSTATHYLLMRLLAPRLKQALVIAWYNPYLNHRLFPAKLLRNAITDAKGAWKNHSFSISPSLSHIAQSSCKPRCSSNSSPTTHRVLLLLHRTRSLLLFPHSQRLAPSMLAARANSLSCKYQPVSLHI